MTSSNIHLYHVRYWSGVDWAYTSCTVLAADEPSVRAWVGAQCRPEHRNKPYRLDQAKVPYVDSLVINDIGPIDLPYPIQL